MATRTVTGSGYGCGHTVTSGRLLDDHEFGHGVKDAGAGLRFLSADVRWP